MQEAGIAQPAQIETASQSAPEDADRTRATMRRRRHREARNNEVIDGGTGLLVGPIRNVPAARKAKPQGAHTETVRDRIVAAKKPS